MSNQPESTAPTAETAEVPLLPKQTKDKPTPSTTTVTATFEKDPLSIDATEPSTASSGHAGTSNVNPTPPVNTSQSTGSTDDMDAKREHESSSSLAVSTADKIMVDHSTSASVVNPDTSVADPKHTDESLSSHLTNERTNESSSSTNQIESVKTTGQYPIPTSVLDDKITTSIPLEREISPSSATEKKETTVHLSTSAQTIAPQPIQQKSLNVADQPVNDATVHSPGI